MTNNKRLAKGAIFSLIATLLDKLHLFLLILLIAKLLGSNELGSYSLLQSTATMLATIISAGIGSTATRYCGMLKNDPDELGNTISTLLCIFIFLSVITTLCIIFFPEIINIDDFNFSFGNMTFIISLIFFFQASAMISINILRGFESFTTITKILVIRSAISLPVSILLTVAFGTSGAILGLLIFYLTWLILLFTNILKQLSSLNINISIPKLKNFSVIINVINFALPFTIASIISGIYNWYLRTIIAKSPFGFQGLGIFTAVNQYALLFTMISGAIGTAAIPVLSSHAKNIDEWKDTFSIFIKNCLRIILPALLFLVPITSYLLLIFGKEFSTFNIFAKILLIALAINSIIWTIGPAMLSKGKGWAYLILNAVRFTLSCGISWLLLKHNFFTIMPLCFIVSDFSVCFGLLAFMIIKSKPTFSYVYMLITVNSKITVLSAILLIPSFFVIDLLGILWSIFSTSTICYYIWKDMKPEEKSGIHKRINSLKLLLLPENNK